MCSHVISALRLLGFTNIARAIRWARDDFTHRSSPLVSHSENSGDPALRGKTIHAEYGAVAAEHIDELHVHHAPGGCRVSAWPHRIGGIPAEFTVVLERVRVDRVGPGRPPQAAGAGAGRQGLFLPRQPGLPAVPGHPGDHPGQGGPAGPLQGQGIGRRTPAGVRPRRLPAATPWNAASTCSNNTALWPPATTSWPSAMKPPSTSPRSTSGSAASNGTYETRPSRGPPRQPDHRVSRGPPCPP